MEEKNHFPRHPRRLALKPPSPPEVTPGRKRRHHSTETNTINTSGEASSSHIPELAQVFFTHPGSSTVVETRDRVLTATHGHDPSNQ